MTVSKPNYADLRQYMDDRFASVSSATAAEWTFKQDPTFFQYMEHVSKEHGAQYLQCIETQYPQVTFEALRAFVQTNDRYGGSTKFIFTFHCTVSQSTKLLYCSPSTLRYAFQALLTLDYMSKTECRCLVEWGAGYGGMFLAVQAFAGLFYPDGGLDQVVLVEMPEVVPLLTAYVAAATAAPTALAAPSSVSYHIVSANGELPPVQGAFFVSHFCFTELDASEQARIRGWMGACAHGLLTWQTCFGDAVEGAGSLLGVNVERTEEEVPATAPSHVKNHYVYF